MVRFEGAGGKLIFGLPYPEARGTLNLVYPQPLDPQTCGQVRGCSGRHNLTRRRGQRRPKNQPKPYQLESGKGGQDQAGRPGSLCADSAVLIFTFLSSLTQTELS